MNDEMTVYFSRKNFDGEVPENILTQVRSTFSKFTVETDIDGTVTVYVPSREKELVDTFQNDVHRLLSEIMKKNNVLAGKLARKTQF